MNKSENQVLTDTEDQLSTAERIKQFFIHTEPLPENWIPTVQDVDFLEINTESFQLVERFFRSLMKQISKLSKALVDIDPKKLNDEESDAYDRIRKTGMVALNAKSMSSDMERLVAEVNEPYIAVIRHPNTNDIIAAGIFGLFKNSEVPELASALCVSPLYQRGFGSDRSGKGSSLGTTIITATYQRMLPSLVGKTFITGLTPASQALLEKQNNIRIEPAYPDREGSRDFRISIIDE